MAIGNKQIGWSQEANLLWEISRQLDRIRQFMCTGPCPPTTTTTTTSGSCDCRPGTIIGPGWNYFDCQGINRICIPGDICRIPAQPCFDISKPYTGIEVFEGAPWICPPCS